jgi:hypothetical protein
MIAENRIFDCGGGISVRGPGHTVTGNHIAGYKSSAIKVCGYGDGAPAAENLLIHENTIVNNGATDTAAIAIGKDASGAIQGNYFYGMDEAGAFKPLNKSFVIGENTVARGLPENGIGNVTDDGFYDGVDNDEDSDAEDGYIEASAPDDESDGDGNENDGDSGGPTVDNNNVENIFDFMFNRDNS